MNNGNLKRGNPDTQFRTGREQVETARKGGKASGVSRGFRSTAKRFMKDNPDNYNELIQMLYSQSLEGNIKAVELLIELTGESPKQMELKLKKAELKLKEQAMQKNEPVKTDEEPMLYKALGAEEE